MKRLLITVFFTTVSAIGSYHGYAQQINPAKDYDLTEYFGLTSALNVGQEVELYFKGSNVWIDLNNNQVFDEGEQALVNTTLYKKYKLGSQTIRIYGHVDEFLCKKSRLTSVDFTHYPKLKVLGLSKNELTSIDLSKNLELNYIECNSNQLEELDLSNLNQLSLVSCQDNKLSKLDISNKPDLYFLSVAKNRIKEKEMDDIVKNFPQMTYSNPGSFFVATLSPNEQNIISVDQVALAKSKKWDVKAWDGSGWSEYEGVDTSLESVDNHTTRFRACYVGGVLYLENLLVGQSIDIYGVDGQLLYQTVAEKESLSIPYYMKLGIHLIKNGNRTIKLYIGD